MNRKLPELAEEEIPAYKQPGFDIVAATQDLQELSKGFDEIFALLDKLAQEDIQSGYTDENR